MEEAEEKIESLKKELRNCNKHCQEELRNCNKHSEEELRNCNSLEIVISSQKKNLETIYLQ
jgi:hypothetical protein